MSAPLQGLVHRYGDEVNTDVILPGRYLALRRPEELREHCLEGLDPGFVRRVRFVEAWVSDTGNARPATRQGAAESALLP